MNEMVGNSIFLATVTSETVFENILNKQNIFNIYFVVGLRTLMKKKYHLTILKIVA
jgi:hypothetical protein